MGNYTSLFLNVLVELGLLSKADAEALHEEFATTTLPADFESCNHLVVSAFEHAGIELPAKK
jgi:hypothetical protein